MSEHVDLCVIGAGTAGFAAAECARAAGRSVVLITTPGDLGGTCIRRGCMPAKTLFSATEELGVVEKAPDFGIKPDGVRVDLPAIVARKRELVEYFAADRIAELEQYPLVRGRARFVADDAVAIGDRRIEAERFVVATGSRIVPAPIPGLAETRFFTSDEALEMTELPPSIAVVGGGPVGCEFAQYFARLGARVVLLQAEPQLLRNEDRDLADAVRAGLEHDRVEVRCGVQLERVRERDGNSELILANGEHLTVARVMLAAERRPDVANLGLEDAGVVLRDGAIVVDEHLRTTNPRIFAAGDVLGRRCLVHVAEWAGRIAAQNAFAADPQPAHLARFEAHAVYTQPQLAVAGLTEAEARARHAVRIARHPFSDIGKALVSDAPEGFIKMIADGDGRIVGVGIVSEDAIDLIGEAVALIDRGAHIDDVLRMPHLHPTMGEIYVRVAERLAA